jgi:hypothetical protein
MPVREIDPNFKHLCNEMLTADGWWDTQANICKGTYASVRLSKRIDHTGRDTIANEVRVIVRVYVYGKILGKNHDPHEQSI